MPRSVRGGEKILGRVGGFSVELERDMACTFCDFAHARVD